jgi:hypothetical protein
MDTKHGIPLNRKAWTEADKENFKVGNGGTPAPFLIGKHRTLAERHGLAGPMSFEDTHMDNRDDPEILAIAVLPSAEGRRRREIDMNGVEIAVSMLDGPNLPEHRRKELALVRLMAVAIDVILNTGESDLDTRIETARDMIREFRNVYPEACEV